MWHRVLSLSLSSSSAVSALAYLLDVTRIEITERTRENQCSLFGCWMWHGFHEGRKWFSGIVNTMKINERCVAYWIFRYRDNSLPHCDAVNVCNNDLFSTINLLNELYYVFYYYSITGAKKESENVATKLNHMLPLQLSPCHKDKFVDQCKLMQNFVFCVWWQGTVAKLNFLTLIISLCALRQQLFFFVNFAFCCHFQEKSDSVFCVVKRLSKFGYKDEQSDEHITFILNIHTQ